MVEKNTMDFVSPELSSSLLQRLYEQKKSSRFCDITLYVNERIMKAHRNVLASSSLYFDSILKQHQIVKEQLLITCYDSDIFNTILTYMYTGQIRISYENVEELLKLADFFLITKIVEYCIEFLGTKLNIATCLFTYFLTQRFKLKHLGSIVENWIQSHLEEVYKGEEILNLKPEQLQDLFKNKSFVQSTSKVLDILAQWTLVEVEKREKHFDKLLRCFPTHSMDPIEVFKHLDTCILYSKSDLCTFKFLDYLFQNNWMLSNFKARHDILSTKFSQHCNDKEEENEKELQISVTQKLDTSEKSKAVSVRPKNCTRKKAMLKKLMLLGLRPSLRMAALKMLTCKQKKYLMGSDMEEDSGAENSDEKIEVKCPICSTSINDSLLLEQHLALSHSKDVTYKCGICSFVCQYHGDYLNHMKTHFAGPPFKCDFCETTTDTISKLIAHRAIHSEESVFQCTFCPFKCRLKQNFAAHTKVHAAPEKAYKCESCPKAFRFRQNLESHVALTHAQDKALTCDSCGFSSKFLSHMIAHKRVHAGDVYRCSYPHCKYSTSKKNQLIGHAKSHNGVRPHACAVCGRGFMEKSHLVRHERIHLDEKPFKCTGCDYASSRRDKLKEHFTRHHGENASAKVPYKARPMRGNGSSSRPKSQSGNHEPPSSTNNTNGINFTQSASASTSSSITQPLNSEIQDLIMHHQSHPPSTAGNQLPGLNPANYHHFAETPATDFHHHSHAHNAVHNPILGGGHNQRSQHHNNNLVNHHMLTRANHSAATSTAAAVAAAMMLDPRFHHNSTVPYHPSTTPVSMAMAAVQSSQQIQGSAQHTDYPTSLQNCMTLF